jgi:two-component system chemotaxis response regulator CheB
MSKIRVLVVDDAVVVRRLVSEVLAGDPGIEVLGTASNGRLALERIALTEPDLVTLDLEMPDMDGLATLRVLRRRYPRLPVIMLSRFTQRCAAATIEALTQGATDYVALPENSSAAATHEVLRDQLVPRILMLGGKRGRSVEIPPPPPKRSDSVCRAPVATRVELIAIGVSTGGPNALATLLPTLPADLPVPIVITQHMPPGFTRQLADRLSKVANVPVREAVSGALLEPRTAWIAPGDYHLLVERSEAGPRLRTNREPPENSCRPSVDVLVRSVAATCGSGGLAVILTGMGQDGLQGCEALRQAGGQILAQDEASSVVWGMPGYVTRAGLADAVFSLEQMGPEIVRRVRRFRSLSSCGG